MYHPTIGRFISKDTLRVDSLNRYLYVVNNPVNAMDPSGLTSKNIATPFDNIDWRQIGHTLDLNGSTYYSVRDIFEHLGGDVHYSYTTKQANLYLKSYIDRQAYNFELKYNLNDIAVDKHNRRVLADIFEGALSVNGHSQDIPLIYYRGSVYIVPAILTETASTLCGEVGNERTGNLTFTPVDNIYDFKDKYGDLIEEYAKEMGVDPNALGAIIFTESSGGGFYENGSLKIRFEDHIFLNSWAGTNGKYSEYFIHSSSNYSKEKYRWTLDGEWLQTHIPGNQQFSEHDAFKLALSLDEDAAYNSISMGFGQIMGFNYKAAGYNSAKEMYRDFSKGELQQIQGMMTFINKYDGGSLLESLQNRDYDAFGWGYNNSSAYGLKISDNIDLYGGID